MAKLRLEIPEIRDDSTGIASAEIREEIRSLSSDIRDLKAEGQFLRSENKDLSTRYEQREDQYGYQVRQSLEEQHQEALSKERQARHTEEISREWPNALKRVADKHNYTPEDMQELDDRARDAGYAQLSQGLESIEDIEAFLEAQAVRLDQTMDRYHRRQSGIYAQQVTGRTQPVQPSAPAPAPAQAQADDSLDSLYRRTRATLAENRRV
jgi:chromosome segregation ATPase